MLPVEFFFFTMQLRLVLAVWPSHVASAALLGIALGCTQAKRSPAETTRYLQVLALDCSVLARRRKRNGRNLRCALVTCVALLLSCVLSRVLLSRVLLCCCGTITCAITCVALLLSRCCHLLLAIYYWLHTSHYSLLAIHYSLFTTCYLLLTICYRYASNC